MKPTAGPVVRSWRDAIGIAAFAMIASMTFVLGIVSADRRWDLRGRLDITQVQAREIWQREVREHRMVVAADCPLATPCVVHVRDRDWHLLSATEKKRYASAAGSAAVILYESPWLIIMDSSSRDTLALYSRAADSVRLSR